MQDDLVVLVDNRRHIQRDAGKERLHFYRRRSARNRSRRLRTAGHFRHEKLVRTDFEHRLLVIQRRDARAGQHMHITLRLQEIQQCGKIAGLECQTEQRAGYRAGRQATMRLSATSKRPVSRPSTVFDSADAVAPPACQGASRTAYPRGQRGCSAHS